MAPRKEREKQKTDSGWRSRRQSTGTRPGAGSGDGVGSVRAGAEEVSRVLTVGTTVGVGTDAAPCQLRRWGRRTPRPGGRGVRV